MRVRIVAVAVASALVATLAGGCSGGDDEQAGPKTTVLVPGRPGEPNRTEVRGPAPSRPPTADEIRFMQMMIPHHRQALEMSALAPQRASSAQVKTFAERINLAQKGEIALMESWLKQNAKAVSAVPSGGHGGHGSPSVAASGHAGMPGMATPQQMAQLKAAKGEAFDRLFLTLMINHHQGALTMSKQALGRGEDAVAQELMRDVLGGQQGEIIRMRDLLAKM
jgi:uncharacterized protein (DUF305 family)